MANSSHLLCYHRDPLFQRARSLKHHATRQTNQLRLYGKNSRGPRINGDSYRKSQHVRNGSSDAPDLDIPPPHRRNLLLRSDGPTYPEGGINTQATIQKWFLKNVFKKKVASLNKAML